MKLFSWYDGLSRAQKVPVWSVLWLGPLFLAWAGLIVLSHQTTEWAIRWTQRLFGWMVVMTYVFLWGLVIRMGQRPRQTLFRGIACTITLLGLILCLELPATLKLVHWGLIFEQLSGEPQNYLWAYQRDQELEFRRRPNDHWEGYLSSDIEYGWLMPRSRHDPLVFTYDKWGYRNTVDLQQADVALIGDSYVEGWYVSDTETTAHRLQTRLSRPVVNLGIAGYGTQQELLVLKKDGIQFNPRIVVFFFFEGNDLYDDDRFEYSLLSEASNVTKKKLNPQGFVWTQSLQERSFTFHALRRLRRISDQVLPNNSPYFGRLTVQGAGQQVVYFANYAAVPWDDWVANRWKKARETLAQVAKFSDERNIRVLFAFVPIKFRVYSPFVTFLPDSPCATWSVWPIAELFLDFCQSTGVPCLNLTELFQENVQDGGMPYSAVDSHWSPEGHDLVAKKLETELQLRGWLSKTPTDYRVPVSVTTRQ